MHELSIAQALLDTVSAWHDVNGGARVLRVSIEIGRLAGVDPEALEYAWKSACEAAGETSFFRDCRLEERLLPLRYRCDSCGKNWETEHFLSECPGCSGKKLFREGGRELTLKEIEVE